MLEPGKVEPWVTRRPPRAWAAGDGVFFWKSAPALQLVGLGSIEAVRAPDTNGESWFDLLYLTAPFETPPTIDELRADPIIGVASFLKAGAAGTVFPLTEAQAAQLLRVIRRQNPRQRRFVWKKSTRPEPTGIPTRALSVRQPWAELIMRGEKTIEVRSLRTNIRGRVHIYASLRDVNVEDQVRVARTYARVLLTTFSDPLANALQTRLKRLLGSEPRLGERIDVHSLNAIGLRLHRAHVGVAMIASPEVVRELIKEAAVEVPGHKFTQTFLLAEWDQVVDAWQLESWESYRDVVRLGRKTRIPEAQRKTLWAIFERVRVSLVTRKLITLSEMFTALAKAISNNKNTVFDFAVVDESQDIGVGHLRFLAALGGGRPNALFFTGDLGQRIFQQPFSWKALGVDIRGRSRTLKVNYRTSHQIRSQADRLLGPVVTDVDGNKEDRSAVSVFNGPQPTISVLKNESEEGNVVGEWIAERGKGGLLPHEIGVFVRSEAQLARAQAAVKSSGMQFKVLDEHVETASGRVSIGTMPLAKGLEFRAVAVMACDDEVVPLQERIEAVGDEADLEEIYDTERNLLYVACTRARDELLVTSVEPASEFLDDLRA
jgi:superfamily I DNA/RNA helicase